MRQGRVAVMAEARITRQGSTLPASGWHGDLQSLFAVEVREEAALAHLGPLGERADGHAVQPDLARQGQSMADDGVPRGGSLAHEMNIVRPFVFARAGLGMRLREI